MLDMIVQVFESLSLFLRPVDPLHHLAFGGLEQKNSVSLMLFDWGKFDMTGLMQWLLTTRPL